MNKDENTSQAASDCRTNSIRFQPPRHYMVSSACRTDDERFDRSTEVPAQCLRIEISSQHSSLEMLGIVVIDPGAYSSVQSLFNELYNNYLNLEPYTYGRDWVLSEINDGVQRLVLPLSWVSCERKEEYELDRDWASQTSLNQCGLVPGSNWQIRSTALSCRGLAVHDEKLFQMIRDHPKASTVLTGECRVLDVRVINPVLAADYEYVYVLAGCDWDDLIPRIHANQCVALVQNSTELKDDDWMLIEQKLEETA